MYKLFYPPSPYFEKRFSELLAISGDCAETEVKTTLP